MEIRGSALAAGPAWPGTLGILYGSCVLRVPFEIGTPSADDWAALRSRHLAPGVPPYERSWASPLHGVRQLRALHPYPYPRGAIGIVRYTKG